MLLKKHHQQILLLENQKASSSTRYDSSINRNISLSGKGPWQVQQISAQCLHHSQPGFHKQKSQQFLQQAISKLFLNTGPQSSQEHGILLNPSASYCKKPAGSQCDGVWEHTENVRCTKAMLSHKPHCQAASFGLPKSFYSDIKWGRLSDCSGSQYSLQTLQIACIHNHSVFCF